MFHSHILLLFVLTILWVSFSNAQESWEVSIGKAGEAFDRNDYETASALLKEACPPGQRWPDNAIREALCLQGEGGLSSARGEILDAVRLFEKAREAWERARLDEKTVPRSNEQFAALNFNMGVLYKEIGRYRDAEPRFREAHALYVKVRGEATREATSSLTQLGATLTILGQVTEAETVLNKALAIHRKFPISEIEKASTLAVLAQLRLAQGEREEAKRLMQDAEKTHRPHVREPDLRYADILVCLAAVYRVNGENSRAQPLLRKALHAYDISGQGSLARKVGTLRELALLEEADGKKSIAEEKLIKALDLARDVYGPESIDTALVENDLGRMYAMDSRRYDRSETLLKHALSVVSSIYGEGHRDTGIIHGNLAVLYERWKKAPEASVHYQGAVSSFQQMLGPQHAETSGMLRAYDRFRNGLGRKLR